MATVAQALASRANDLLVTDTAANIANNLLSSSSLVSFVTLLRLSGNGSVTAVQAAASATQGNRI